jgi:aryl-alcohol dehydrogenase-like predicted oxidoreductase
MEGSTMRTLIPTGPLGTADLQITRLGFGAWAMDGAGWSFGWGAEDEGDSSAAIRQALDLGTDWIDTATVYDLGHSDEVVGAELCDLSRDDRPYVFTKCGLIFEEGSRSGEPRRTFWPDSIRQECETSLRRLGVERVDLYQLHWPDERDTGAEESLSAPMPTYGVHRTGLMWFSPSQADILSETFSRAPTTASPVAVAWTLTSRGVAGAIVGASSADQIEGWIDAVTLVLSRANLGEIVTAIGRTGAGHRPQLPATLAA